MVISGSDQIAVTIYESRYGNNQTWNVLRNSYLKCFLRWAKIIFGSIKVKKGNDRIENEKKRTNRRSTMTSQNGNFMSN
jgi:hypothetical protein